MSFINCKECGKRVSIKAEICPHCGVYIDHKSQKILKVFTILIFVLGVGLMSISTFMFLSGIPNIDTQILSIEHYLNGMQDNHSYFQALDIKAFNANTTLHTLYCIPYENERYRRIHHQFETLTATDYLQTRKKQLEIFTPPDTFKIMNDTIYHMRQLDSLVQLRLEITRNNINRSIDYVNDLYDKKNEKSKRATIFQIFGLLINQLGIILQIFSYKRS